MRCSFARMALAGAGLLAGCISSTYTKSVTVTHDADGNVTGVVITETVSQPVASQPLNLEYIRVLRQGEQESPPPTPVFAPTSN